MSEKKKKGIFGTWGKKDKKKGDLKDSKTEEKRVDINNDNKNEEPNKKEKRRSIRFHLKQSLQEATAKPNLKDTNLKTSQKIEKKSFNEGDEDLKKKLQNILPRNLLKEIQGLKEVELIIGNKHSKLGVKKKKILKNQKIPFFSK